MALEPGGRGDKLGNRYEGWWVARQLLHVIRGCYRCVSVERIGDDERGVDLWVTHARGHREAQQCKADNRGAGRWSIHHLRSRGVLQHLKFQLDRGPDNHFAFVSAVDAPELRTLSERAHSCASASDYLDHQVGGKTLRPAFQVFCTAIGLNPGFPADVELAHDLLRRTAVHLFPRTAEARADVEALAEYLFAGIAPRLVITYLADFAQEHFDRELHADTLLTALRGQGARPRDLVRESSLVPRVQALSELFTESIRRVLIGGRLIPRPEASRLIAWLESADAKRIAVVHGRAGDGKSSVLLEFSQHLCHASVPFLALRLDRPLPGSSARLYGEALDLPASPAQCIAAVAGERPAVLMLDQLDAVRWTAAHASAAWEGCRELIAQAKAHPNVRIVLACRTFDWREDPQLKQWEGRQWCEEIELGTLSDAEVERVVNDAGGRYAELNARQKSLLRSAQCLSLWSVLQADRATPKQFRTTSELMRAFWRNRRERIAAAGVPSSDVDAAIELLVRHMDQNGKLEAPERLLDRYPQVARELKSLNVITVTRASVSFAHQSYLDFLVGERVIDSLNAGGNSVADWLKGHQQSLFRREQLRQVLQLLRDENETQYLLALSEVLADNSVRFHLKHLVMQHLGQSDPPVTGEVQLVARLLQDADWREHVSQAIFRKAAWLMPLVEHGVLSLLLASSADDILNRTVWLLWGWAEVDGNAVARLISPFLTEPGGWQQRLHYVVHLHECENSRALFDIRLELVRRGTVSAHDLWCQKLAVARPTWCAELLEARLTWMVENWDKLADERMRGDDAFPIVVGKHHFEWLEPALKSAAAEVWDRLVPLLQTLVRRRPASHFQEPQTFVRDSIWYGMDVVITDDHLDLVALIAGAGASLAESDPAGLVKRLQRIYGSCARTLQRLTIEVLLKAPVSFADDAITWLCDEPARFRLDRYPNEGRWELAWQLIRRFARSCAQPVYERLEATILAYREPYEFDSLRRRYADWRSGGVLTANYFGFPRRALLDALPPERMSAIAKDTKGVLDRKFEPQPARPCRYDGQDSPVEHGLTDEVIQRLSDRSWLKLIIQPPQEKFRRDRRGSRYRRADLGTISSQLRRQVVREPQRFAKLSLALPVRVDERFICAIVDGLAQTHPPDDDAGLYATAWQPVSVPDIELVISHFAPFETRDMCFTMCNAITERSDADWSNETLANLCDLALTHPDPPRAPPNKTNVVWRRTESPQDDEVLPSDIVVDSQNHVRSVAGRTIAALVKSKPDRLSVFQPTIEQLVRDPAPAVSAAALRICLALLDSEAETAVRLFLEAAADVGPAMSVGDVDVFLGRAGHKYLDALAPAMRTMADSPIPAVATLGAGRTTGAWLQLDRMADEVEAYRRGTKAQRRGVAIVAADWLDNEAYLDKCLALLPDFFDDEDPEVRRAATGAFTRPVLDLHGLPELAHSFVSSRAIRDHGAYLLHALERHAGSLTAYTAVLFEICKLFAGPFADESRDLRYSLAGDARYVARLLLRRYEQAQDERDSTTQQHCLDLWDRMLRARVGSAPELLDTLDA